MEIRRLAAATMIAALTLTSCSSGNQEVPSAGGSAEVGTTNDINPQDPATLQTGGNLRVALSEYPPNFNSLHIDGNTVDTGALMRPTMPRAYRVASDGSTSVNTDYFTSIELTGTDPQVVTYTINPKAVWSDGAPITWEDIKFQIQATSGKDKAFAIASVNGSDRVASVTRGVDDRQAVMTFAQPYAEWQGMFAGNTMLMPKSMTANPEVFNKGELNGPGPSAGPFMATNLDRSAQRITLTRNPKWWGTPPLLDSITFLVLSDEARIPALQNNTIDATGVASLDELTIARNTPGISIRRAPSASWYHFTFNGAPGSILADKALRLAIAKGIDRQAIANITQRGLADNPVPLNNHMFVAGQEGYQDNSGVVAFDPEKAKEELDALGWRLNGQFREKDGRQLVIRDVFTTHNRQGRSARSRRTALRRSASSSSLTRNPAAASSPTTSSSATSTSPSSAGRAIAFSLCCLEPDHPPGRRATSARSAARRSTRMSNRGDGRTGSCRRRARWPTRSTS